MWSTSLAEERNVVLLLVSVEWKGWTRWRRRNAAVMFRTRFTWTPDGISAAWYS